MAIIVWVYGGSASGKETFIRNIKNKSPKNLVNFLNWNDKKIKVSQKSIDYIAKDDNDPIGNKREEILDEVLELAKQKNSIILIKGQDLDLENNRLERLKEMLPLAEHIIIYLYTDLKKMYDRVKRKSWWTKNLTKEEYLKWAKYQVKLLSKLSGFEIIALDSGNDGGYKQKVFPPKF